MKFFEIGLTSKIWEELQGLPAFMKCLINEGKYPGTYIFI